MLEKKYNHLEVEKEKYNNWKEKGYFESGDLSKKPYCIVIPPPNVTGKLHMGHALDATIQDIVPVEISEQSLKAIGAIKSPFGVEFMLMAGDKEFYIKKDINSSLWLCARLHKYRPPFAKVRFIHELQRYLLDTYMTTLSL